jgi:hypothetical protein
VIRTIVIVGGGRAGVQAADTLRREGFKGRLILLSEESYLPYQRPPLSKKYLSGTAALNMLDRPTAHDRVPWFRSDQFENKLLIVGLSYGYDQKLTRGDPATRSFTVCYLKGGELLAVETVNHSKDYMAARKLIADRARPDTERLADPQISLRDALPLARPS